MGILKISINLITYILLSLFLTYSLYTSLKNNDLLEFQIKKNKYSEVNVSKEMGSPWNEPGNFLFDYRGIEIDLEKTVYRPYIEIGFSGRNSYEIIFYKKSCKVGRMVVSPDFVYGITPYGLKVPHEITETGYNIIRIYPLRGDGTYSIGYLKLLEKDEWTEKFSTPLSFDEFYDDQEAPLETIKIRINDKDFDKIKLHRDISLYGVSKELLDEAPRSGEIEDYIKSLIEYKGEIYNGGLRLKGDFTDHISKSQKWSFRIKLSGSDRIFGVKTFSIQHPSTRSYLNEWLYHRILVKEDIISLRYDFIRVFLNDMDLGIFAMEEHFDKYLIENRKYREGPIIKFNENYLWNSNRQYFVNNVMEDVNNLNEDTVMDINCFQTNRTLKNIELSSQFILAKNLLESFRLGNLTVREVFNLNKLAKFYALADLLGSHHNLKPHNLRFYYNPVTSLLEPVGFDGDVGATGSDFIMGIYYYSAFDKTLFKDREFLKKYVEYIEKFSKKTYVDNIFEEFDKDISEKLKILNLEFHDYRFPEEYKRYVYEKQEYMKKSINASGSLKLYFNKFSNKKLFLKGGNNSPFPVEITGFFLGNREVNLENSIILQPKYISSLISFKDIIINMPEDISLSEETLKNIKFKCTVSGSTGSSLSKILLDKEFPAFFYNDNNYRKSNFKEFDFLIVEKEKKIITIKTGKWQIKKEIIIPEGYKLVCNKNTELDLVNSAGILTYSPVEFTGSSDNPVIISSSDSSGQGLLVLKAEDKSILKNVIFHNMSNSSTKKRGTAGAVTFYKSPVQISFCRFQDIKAKAGLHIISTECSIDSCEFENISLYGFIGDFVIASLSNTFFKNFNNDGIYSYNGKITLKNVKVHNAGKSGLTFLETIVHGTNLEIKNSKKGITCKDSSKITINNLQLSSVITGLFANKENSEADRNYLKIDDLDIDEKTVETIYWVDKDTYIIIDGKEVEPDRQ